eukprot:241253-Pelagomonas_calceolata.AAC.2
MQPQASVADPPGHRHTHTHIHLRPWSCSPKQVWLIHRDMLWSPARALQQASHAALAEGRHYPASNHSQASTSSTMLSSACPMMTADRPSADSDSAVVHHGCPVAGQSGHSQAASMTSADSDSTMSKSGLDGCPVAGPSWTAAGPSSMLGACPVTPTHRLSANSDSTSVHNGCPVAGHSQAEGGVGPPILRPDHVNILVRAHDGQGKGKCRVHGAVWVSGHLGEGACVVTQHSSMVGCIILVRAHAW